MKTQKEKAKTGKPSRRRVPKRTACPGCGSKNLLTFGPDQFCGDCHWDTCREYVELGLMNNLELSFLESIQSTVKQTDSKTDTPKHIEAPNADRLKATA